MARPQLHGELMETATVRVIAGDWADLHAAAGSGRPEIVRQLIACYLRRGDMPQQPTKAELARITAARCASSSTAAS
jgi:hypothetical protein